MNPKHLHILQHALGLDTYGRGKAYRNHYATEPGSDSFADCAALAAAGLMQDQGAISMWGGMRCFTVTDAGKTAVREQSPAPPKLTRAQRRYRAFQDADCSLSFGEWLRAMKGRAFE